MNHSISKYSGSDNPLYSLELNVAEHSVSISGGHFGSLKLIESPLFELILESTAESSAGTECCINSISVWQKTNFVRYGDTYRITLWNPDGLGDITLVYILDTDESGISWKVEVINDSSEWSVSDITYPLACVSADKIDMFTPEYSGRYIKDIGKSKSAYEYGYPGRAAMQYFSFFNNDNGMYIGIHDSKASVKKFKVAAGGNTASLRAVFPAINAGSPCNSFNAGGYMRWEAFKGDWYDAAMLYSDFVRSHAEWLPEINEDGRPDTCEKYKDIVFWIADYIPNSPSQRDARPMVLAAVSHLYGKDYWFEAPIELKKRLRVPVAYHVYNWHEIPFNINYPHFTPAREEYFRGIDALKEAGIYVMPYINAVSWEKHDSDEGFELNFRDIGCKGAALDKNGQPFPSPYPQKKSDGERTQLMAMCPSSSVWHKQIEHETREIERTMKVDGIYFDEVAAHSAHPCRSTEHTHLPGGGSYWAEDFNLMMSKIRKEKPDESFYFTENNAEPYMKSFDGYLTWMWWNNHCVPAYPAVYAGYIQMIGRYTDGANREDDLMFRYHIASSLIYGQQLGWLNAVVVYNEKRMEFLEKAAQARYGNVKMFSRGRMLRPPKVRYDGEAITSSGVEMELVISGAWQLRNGSDTLLFISNVSDTSRECEIEFSLSEYGIEADKLPEGFSQRGNAAYAEYTLDACSIKAIKLK